MATTNTVLDEAVHSFERKIVRSIAGTAFLVLGAAGAMAVPDLLSATSLSTAFASWQSDPAQTAERKIKLANFGSLGLEARNAYAQHIEAAPAVVSDSNDTVPMPAPAPVARMAPVERPAPIAVSAAPRRVVVANADPVVEPTIALPAIAALAPVKPAPTALTAAPAMNVFSPSFTSDQPLVTAAIPAPDMTATPDPVTVAQEIAAVIPDQVYQWPEGAKPVVAPPVPEVKKADAPPPPPPTPAEQLGLKGKERLRAEKCLAQAIYFESRNEPVRGQIAVAQVVMNRVFSPYYPKDVCSVVFQNAHRLLSCQFTFACDGQPETIRERGPWSRAQRIAKQTLDAKVWLPEVAKSTHYHASYVRPVWVREMKKMARYGLHTFYRPWRWGDGSNEAGWGHVKEAKAVTKKS